MTLLSCIIDCKIYYTETSKKLNHVIIDLNEAKDNMFFLDRHDFFLFFVLHILLLDLLLYDHLFCSHSFFTFSYILVIFSSSFFLVILNILPLVFLLSCHLFLVQVQVLYFYFQLEFNFPIQSASNYSFNITGEFFLLLPSFNLSKSSVPFRRFSA